MPTTPMKTARPPVPLPGMASIWRGNSAGIYCASTGRRSTEGYASHPRRRPNEHGRRQPVSASLFFKLGKILHPRRHSLPPLLGGGVDRHDRKTGFGFFGFFTLTEPLPP